MRLFWALPAPDAFRAWMAALQGELRPRLSGARWTDVRQAHLTLCFLGDVAEEAAPEVLAAGRRALQGLKAISLEGAGWIAFPRAERARVLALGVTPDTRLMEAHARLSRAMSAFAPLEDRPFRPHLTLARFAEPVRLPALPELPSAPAWRAVGAVLMQSVAKDGGTEHRPVGEAALGA